MNMFNSMLRKILGVFALGMMAVLPARAADDVGIFERILEASGSFEETTIALEKGLAESKLTLYAKHDLKTPEGVQKARVYVLTSPVYLEAAKSAPANAASAQILRLAVYQFGAGKKTAINMANPVAHAMVYYAELKDYPQLLTAAKAAAQELREVASKVPGKAVTVQLEPTRGEKTLNSFNGDGPAKMMAKWRNWQESQNVVLEAKSDEFAVTVDRVEKALTASKDKGADDASGWKLITKVPVGSNVMYFGISNDYTENKCVRINSDFRSEGKTKDAPYPGVDHAAALPLEVLVINDGKKVRVVQYGEMWRMQLYFWDSGYLAFAKNTFVPETIFSSIEDTLKAK
jgi:hypothetical protein